MRVGRRENRKGRSKEEQKDGEDRMIEIEK